MCFDPVTLAITGAALLGGQMMQQNAIDDAASRSRRLYRQGMAEQDKLNNRAEAIINRTAEQNIDPNAQAQQIDAAADKKVVDLTDFLTRAKAAQPSTQAMGKVSNDYLTTRADRAADDAERAANITRLFSRLAGHQEAGFNRGINLARDQGELSGLSSDRRANATLTSNMMALQRPDPGQMALGQLIQTAGSLYGGSKLAGGGLAGAANSGVNAAAAGGMKVLPGGSFALA